VGIAHWDDVEKIYRERGQMSATLTSLGGPAGAEGGRDADRARARRAANAAPHIHGDAEEIFYVLGLD
jgi:hypothetical protein